MIPTTRVSLQSGIRTCRGQSSERVTRQQDRRPAIPLLRPIDPSLALTRAQATAIGGNRENNEALTYAEFANLCNAQQPMTAHS